MEHKGKHSYEPIENYGIIGDLHTVALVSIKGSIDYMCYTRFDSPTIFAALLDAEKGGSFSIHPQLEDVKYKQLYLPDTAVLITRFFAEEGIAELTDFMPVNEDEYNCAVVRKITTIRGKISYNMRCAPRFNYARTPHKIDRRKKDNTIIFESEDAEKTVVELVSNVPLQVKNNDAFATFELNEGESAYFVLEAAPNQQTRVVLLEEYVNQTYLDTVQYWQSWVGQSKYQGRWREIVNRSALTLKLLTSYRFGSMVAAATFGLPETIAGVRNWDYRYTWIRDGAFTMYTFLRMGFMDEASAFINWIGEQCARGKLQLMYTIDGDTHLPEVELSHLEGYKKSAPVRVGNKASQQFQLDVYGELIDTVYLYNKHGGAITFDFWKDVVGIVEFVMANWKKPDHGIWEIRGGPREFLHSRVMCWVALDRAIKIADDRSFPYPLPEWRNTRDEIFNNIYNSFWNEEKESFVQHKGSSAIDASALLMSLMRILSPAEERWKKTLKAIERELKTDVLIYRYKNNTEHIDGLDGQEGTFTMCSFWYIECLAKNGEIERARESFEKILGYANHLGLFSEQLGSSGQHLGNFPQALTHLALISAALELNTDLTEGVGPPA